MSRRNKHNETENTEALADEAARLEAREVIPDNNPDVLEEAPPADPPAEAPVEAAAEPPPPPPWTPSKDMVPPGWVVRAKRIEWGVASVTVPEGEPLGRWTGGDIDYQYFKGGEVLATFRTGGYGRLKTDPVAKFEDASGS